MILLISTVLNTLYMMTTSKFTSLSLTSLLISRFTHHESLTSSLECHIIQLQIMWCFLLICSITSVLHLSKSIILHSVVQVKNPGITFDMASPDTPLTMKPVKSTSKITPENNQFCSPPLLYHSLRPQHLSFPKPSMCPLTFACASYRTFSKE